MEKTMLVISKSCSPRLSTSTVQFLKLSRACLFTYGLRVSYGTKDQSAGDQSSRDDDDDDNQANYTISEVEKSGVNKRVQTEENQTAGQRKLMQADAVGDDDENHSKKLSEETGG
ncbi:OLC1v1021491C1 [Oldenlandia corymbosa var. corymbosa]|uniref:OLC1v1021491C1 n=1 Tax=Oldenlandia corymbosa var. corymbosa TaxID=529605 RepID=A0AAV1BW08_OLDCO|nr:OLC1v1021491C1 [Oldenlandia corymbosa var. corymbosa]